MTDRLSALDASFLYLERPNVHMHVAGLAVLDPSARPDGTLTFETLRSLIEDRIHLVPRFRQKVMVPPLGAGRAVWVDDERFDVEFHLRRAALPAPGGRRELADYVQRVQSRPLDRTKPLWEMYLIEGLEDGRVAVLTKSHHAMIDGMSGIDIATVLFDLTPEPRVVEPEPWAPQPPPSSLRLWTEGIASTVTSPARSVLGVARTALRAPSAVVERARDIGEGLVTLARSGTAPRSPFNVAVGPNRRFAMAEVPVADAKAIKNALGGTVNDVVLAAVAGALNRLLRARGERPSGMTLRAMVPVSTRDASQRMALGNQVSNFFVDLPIDADDAAERLARISAATQHLKESHQALAAGVIMNATSWTPPTLHALSARLVARQRFANLVISNVPGPQVPLYMAGARLDVAYPIMPLGETMGLSVAVTSLSGVMGFGFTGDWDALPDIDLLAEDLLASVDDLKKAAGI